MNCSLNGIFGIQPESLLILRLAKERGNRQSRNDKCNTNDATFLIENVRKLEFSELDLRSNHDDIGSGWEVNNEQFDNYTFSTR